MICSFKRSDGLMFVSDRPINALKHGQCVRRGDEKIYVVYEITRSPNFWGYCLRQVVLPEDTTEEVNKP